MRYLDKTFSMKRIFTLLLVTALSIGAYSQCTIEPFSVQKKVYMSDVIVEAEVIDQVSVWNDNHDFIYTTNLLKVSSIFKGVVESKTIEILTEGGVIGLTALVVEPSLQLSVGEKGVFLLKNSPITFNNKETKYYKPTASVQSFIKYDLLNKTAHGYFEKFENVETYLFPLIESYTGVSRKVVGKGFFGVSNTRPLATPIISGIDKDTVTGGTGDLLTITGSNFGFAQGDGYVEFVDPNYGDGRFLELHYPTSFKSWSNSKIEVYVPNRAGTGKIRVTNTSSETGLSSQSIVVRYSHSNYAFQGGSGADSGYYSPKHIDLNNNGGYQWTMSDNFAGKDDAVNAFYRAAENWRCGTLMNWDISSSTTTSQAAAKDNINIVRFTNFGDSRLGVCSSWYGGCVTSGVATFYVSELDISFDSTRSWYYGTDKPATSQYDFETVATHELGHGHQLSHVIDDTKIMHYSLSNGDRKTKLHQDDIDGGVYVGDESGKGRVCGKSLYKSITANDCNITKPKANLEANIVTPCPGTSVRFTDLTEGKVTKYNWDFGDDASTGQATGSGPYIVDYSKSGEKTIRLIVSNDFGDDTAFVKITVQPDVPETPTSFLHDTSCVDKANPTYQLTDVPDATSYVWNVNTGGTIVGASDQNAVEVDWATSGDHVVSVAAKNACGSSSELEETITVIDDAIASFDVLEDGMEFDFTNTSQNFSFLVWYFGDGDSSLEDSPKHTYAIRDSYKVELYIDNVCSSDGAEKTITAKFNVGVPTINNAKIELSPNPTTGSITLKTPIKGKFQLTNNLGQVVLEQDIDAANNTILLSVESGVYYYTFINEDNLESHGKIIKK